MSAKAPAGQQSYAPIGVNRLASGLVKRTRTEEPYEGILQVRVCGEGAEKSVPLPGSCPAKSESLGFRLRGRKFDTPTCGEGAEKSVPLPGKIM
jgi:hypothetical protein